MGRYTQHLELYRQIILAAMRLRPHRDGFRERSALLGNLWVRRRPRPPAEEAHTRPAVGSKGPKSESALPSPPVLCCDAPGVFGNAVFYLILDAEGNVVEWAGQHQLTPRSGPERGGRSPPGRPPQP